MGKNTKSVLGYVTSKRVKTDTGSAVHIFQITCCAVVICCASQI